MKMKSLRNRLRIQFSLRGILLFYAIIAVVIAWLSAECVQARREQKVVDWVKSFPNSSCRLKCRFEKRSYLKNTADWFGDFFDAQPFYRVTEVLVSFKGAHRIRNVRVLGQLKSLETLRLEHCPDLHDLDGLEPLKQLKILTLNRCDSLVHLNGVKNIPLKTLVLNCCLSLQDIEVLGEIRTLVDFRLSLPHKLVSLKGLDANTCMTNLDIREGILLNSFSEIGGLRKLESLRIDYTPVNDLSFLKRNTLLERLYLNSVSAKNLDALSNLSSLESLVLDSAQNLSELSGIENLTKLKRLEFLRCDKLKNIESLQDLPALEEVNFWYCRRLNSENIQPLQNMPKLREIVVWACSGIETVTCLTNCPKLDCLLLVGCEALKEVAEKSSSFLALRCLSVSYSPNLGHLGFLNRCRNLKYLAVKGCPQLKRLNIKRLKMDGIDTEYGRLDFENLAHLEFIDLNEESIQALKLRNHAQ